MGTSISGGSGTQPKVEQAVLFLWDYVAEEKVWEAGAPEGAGPVPGLDRPVSVFNALLVGPGGKLYGTVRGGEEPPELFVFDPTSRAFTHRLAPPGTGPPGPSTNLPLVTLLPVYRSLCRYAMPVE